MAKAVVSWIAVADGAHCRVLVNAGKDHGLTLDREFEQKMQPSRDINTDRPGRSFESRGPGRHAMQPPSDPHREQKRHLAHEVAHYLEEARKRGAFERLYLVASPQALGDLRAALSAEVKVKVAGELDKDLTHVPLHDLGKHLAGFLTL